jgi:hypothetical protein
MREQFACRGLMRRETLARSGRAPSTVDEMTERRVVLREPRARGLIVLECGTVLHRRKILGYAHGIDLLRLQGDG